ncbi:MAG TPA: alpha-amylase family glycosyl hydrolase [Labilithrix sp.]
MSGRLAFLSLPLLLAACAITGDDAASGDSDLNTVGENPLNLAAGTSVLYEIQVRTANACRPDTGSPDQQVACAAKPAPKVEYRAEGMQCGDLQNLQAIKLGTLDDLMEDTADYRKGITLRYVKERVGANVVWLMPLFPNNDTWSIPDACDNLGSPYAVRDYLHASGMLSRKCIAMGKDEHGDDKCWANDELDRVVQQAHSRGLKVMLDVALNHFGHNYMMYDYVDHTAVRDRTARGENLDTMWDFDKTFENALVHPEILDGEERVRATGGSLLAEVRAKCPALAGDELVRAYNAYREAFDSERASFTCDATKNFLEFQAPGFYLGRNAFDPAQRVGDNFTNNWVDVKFLYHHEENKAHQWEFAREREYMFRILNYWSSRGVDGFRLDHTTDPDSGMGSNEWKYLTNKVAFYAQKRGQDRPIYLAEEFGDQMEMNKVVDVMTEGYVGDMNGRNGTTKDTAHVETVLENMNRFHGHAFTMTALETHDEKRLLDGTGFDVWTGAGFWGIGATWRGTPMMLMGQELGEPWQLAFRKSDFLRSRFAGTAQFNPQGDALVGYYHAMATGRLAPENRALVQPNHYYLRTKDGNVPDPRIFAAAKWSDDSNVVFVFHNLWAQDVAQTYFIPPDLAGKIQMDDARSYKLVDILSGQQKGNCVSGADLKWSFFVSLDKSTRAQWLRLETCN